MIEARKDNWIVSLFTKGSHNQNLTVFYIVQNLFHQGKGKSMFASGCFRTSCLPFVEILNVDISYRQNLRREVER